MSCSKRISFFEEQQVRKNTPNKKYNLFTLIFVLRENTKYSKNQKF